ncbi:MAG: DUF3179 domain-containing protein [bacterium]|nr:DUF3179 domain-containing protein [bacterium]
MWLGVLLAASLLVAGCGAADDGSEVPAEPPATTADPAAATEGSSTVPGSTQAATTTGAADAPAPSSTAAPDPEGAAPAVAEPAVADPAPEDPEGGPDPKQGLDPVVAYATESWPTDWANRTVDLSELLLGIGMIDPRDAIPPIDDPIFESLDQAAEWLDSRAPGMLVSIGGDSRFYALSILHRHEIVNDRIGGIPVAVTYCPLCNTALVFDSRVGGEELRFGVSGLLRNSDLVMWDDGTVSLWQQVTGEAIVGAAAGTVLTHIPSAIVSFGEFAAAYPDGRSLSRDNGGGIPYGFNPYEGYSSRAAPYPFFTGEVDPRYGALERVVGVTIGGAATAYPFPLLAEVGAVNDSVGGVPITVFWGGDTADALDSRVVREGRAIGTGIAYLRQVDGRPLTFFKEGEVFRDQETSSTWTLLGEAVSGPLAGSRLEIAIHRNEFWFAWGAFFPEGDVYEG